MNVKKGILLMSGPQSGACADLTPLPKPEHKKADFGRECNLDHNHML
jgi:hypothetical protein